MVQTELQGKKLPFLTQRTGKRTPNAQKQCRNPPIFFFPLFFHTPAPNKPMAVVTVVATGTQKSQNSEGQEPSSLVELWFKVGGETPTTFFLSLSSHH